MTLFQRPGCRRLLLAGLFATGATMVAGGLRENSLFGQCSYGCHNVEAESNTIHACRYYSKTQCVSPIYGILGGGQATCHLYPNDPVEVWGCGDECCFDMCQQVVPREMYVSAHGGPGESEQEAFERCCKQLTTADRYFCMTEHM